MSRYAVPTDLVVYGAQSAALASFTSDQQQSALDSASAIADSYLSAKFTLPLTAYGTDLKEAVCKIAAYNLLSARGFNPESGADANIRLRYQDAISWLKGVAKGEITPQATDSSTDSVQAAGGPYVQAPKTDSNGTVVIGAPSLRGF